MSEAPEVDQQTVDFESSMSVGGSVALALRHQRVAAGLAIRDLGRASGVSSAMISRIENAQVSPSLSTLESLARALSVPVISFFQHTIQTADMNFVRAGEGLQAKRFAPDHVHDYRILANFSDTEMTFSAALITVTREDNGTHPMYFARGYVFLTLLEGACIYACGDTENEMQRGDCLSFNAQLRHGVKSVLTKSVIFVTVTAKPA